MSIDRSRRSVFEELADLYNEVRPDYPEALIDDVLGLSGFPAGGRILEIGCGPGNATLAFARRGARLLALELGPRLAALAAENCRAFPGVEIRNVPFEDWELEAAAFDLAVSADAFHWIAPEIGYPRAARALKPGGAAAFFWNVPVDPQTDWSRAIDAVYRAEAPGLENPDRAFTVDWLEQIQRANFAQAGCFGPLTVRRYAWSLDLDAGQYLKLLRTYSGQRDLDDETRARLFAGIRAAIERAGGRVTRPQLALLFLARRGR